MPHFHSFVCSIVRSFIPTILYSFIQSFSQSSIQSLIQSVSQSLSQSVSQSAVAKLQAVPPDTPRHVLHNRLKFPDIVSSSVFFNVSTKLVLGRRLPWCLYLGSHSTGNFSLFSSGCRWEYTTNWSLCDAILSPTAGKLTVQLVVCRVGWPVYIEGLSRHSCVCACVCRWVTSPALLLLTASHSHEVL